MADLTPENFIQKIKEMDKADRNKLKVKELIDLIVQIPNVPINEDARMLKGMKDDIALLGANLHAFSNIATKNQEEIAKLKAKNDTLERANSALQKDIEATKQANIEADENDNDIQIQQLRKEINEIQQYLRVNNLEIVGLPEPLQGESDEKLLLNAVNSLHGIVDPIRPEDIDISHPLKSQRKDGKNVHVVRFISRKRKAEIITAKKSEENKNFKFRENDVFINEHLCPSNRALFASAATKKRTLGYRFLWTKGGNIFMRKDERSEIISITCEDDFLKVV